VHHVGSRGKTAHGTGVADIDGDGKADILTPSAGSVRSCRHRSVGGILIGNSETRVPNHRIRVLNNGKPTSSTARATATESTGSRNSCPKG